MAEFGDLSAGDDPSDPRWDPLWQRTSDIRDLWYLQRCDNGTLVDGGFLGSTDFRAQPEIHDAVKAAEVALWNAGYRPNANGLPDQRGYRTCSGGGIDGQDCESDGTNCSLHNYAVAFDVDPAENPHLRVVYPDEATLFASCQITKAQVQAVEAIRNTDGDQVWRWLGWSIGDTQHFQINVGPEDATLAAGTPTELAVNNTDYGSQQFAGPFTEASTDYTIKATVGADKFDSESDYLVIVTAQLTGDDDSLDGYSCDVAYAGGTGLSDRLARSRHTFEPDATDEGWHGYCWFGVLSQATVPVGLSFRLWNEDDNGTVTARNVSFTWLKLGTEDTDWVSAENAVTTAHVLETPTEVEALTLPNATEDWLILGHSSIDAKTTLNHIVSDLNVGGSLVRRLRWEAQDPDGFPLLAHVWAGNPATTAVNIENWDTEVSGSSFRCDTDGAFLIAIRLGSLPDYQIISQGADITHDDANDWHSTSLLSGTTPSAGVFLVLADILGDTNNAGRKGRTRVRIAGDVQNGTWGDYATHQTADTEVITNGPQAFKATVGNGVAVALEGWATTTLGWDWEDGQVILLGGWTPPASVDAPMTLLL